MAATTRATLTSSWSAISENATEVLVQLIEGTEVEVVVDSSAPTSQRGHVIGIGRSDSVSFSNIESTDDVYARILIGSTAVVAVTK